MFSCGLEFCQILLATHRDIQFVTNGAISDITVSALSTIWDQRTDGSGRYVGAQLGACVVLGGGGGGCRDDTDRRLVFDMIDLTFALLIEW